MMDCLTFFIKFITDFYKLLDNNFIVTGISFLAVLAIFYMLYTIMDRFYPKG